MLTNKGLYIDNACPRSNMILTGVRPYREYRDNKPLDKVPGYQYSVVLPSRAYEQLDVKVPGSKMPDVVSGESFSVVFSNLQVRP